MARTSRGRTTVDDAADAGGGWEQPGWIAEGEAYMGTGRRRGRRRAGLCSPRAQGCSTAVRQSRAGLPPLPARQFVPSSAKRKIPYLSVPAMCRGARLCRRPRPRPTVSYAQPIYAALMSRSEPFDKAARPLSHVACHVSRVMYQLDTTLGTEDAPALASSGIAPSPWREGRRLRPTSTPRSRIHGAEGGLPWRARLRRSSILTFSARHAMAAERLSPVLVH